MTMRQPENRQRGARGQTGAKLFFEFLGWGAIETNGEHDLGTDLLVQIRNKELTDMSLMFGVQVKTGDCWFKEPTVNAGKPGWVFRENNQKHANYWSNHPLPHILVIQNDDLSERYWAFLSRETIQSTGKGFKVFVPTSQPLDPTFRTDWEEATDKALKKTVLDGARWSFDVRSLPKPEQARYALLAAHLVEPHPNKGMKNPISWPEAVALCIASNAERWEHNAAKHSEVPSFSDAADSEEWGWRFAAAIHKWVYGDGTEALENLDSSAELNQFQVAHAVATAVALGTIGSFTEAAASLQRLAIETEYSIEQAWLSVHRSNIAMETGNVAEARRLAQLSFAQLAPVGADVTASSVRAAAAWAMFDTAEMTSGDVGSVASALDNPSAWWRTQKISAGLEAAVQQHFLKWSHDKSIRFGGEYASHNALQAATVQARLSGSFAQAKNSASLLAKIDLSIPSGSGLNPLDALDTLRRSGNDKDLKLAIGEIARRGPLSDLRELVTQVSRDSMTRTSSRADLRVLQCAGIYSEPHHARELVDFLLAVLEDPEEYVAQVVPGYLVGPALLEALAGIRDFILPEQWSRLVECLVTEKQDQSSAQSLGRLLEVAVLTDEDRARLSSALSDAPDWIQGSLRLAIGVTEDADRTRVREELLSGNIDSFNFLRGNLEELDLEEAAAVSAAFASSVEAGRAPGLVGLITRQNDDALNLAKICIKFPEVKEWNSLTTFLGDPGVAAYRKRDAALILACHANNIPPSARVALVEALSSARQQIDRDFPSAGFYKEVGGALDCLYIALLEDNNDRRESILMSLLIGSPQQRRDVTLYLGNGKGNDLLLASLVRDTDPEVAETAAMGLARQIRRASEPNADLVNLLIKLVEEDRIIAFAIVVGIGGAGHIQHDLLPIKEALQSHTSVRVRQLADSLLISSSA